MKVQLEISKKRGVAFLIVITVCIMVWVGVENRSQISKWFNKIGKQTNSTPQTSDELTNQEIGTISKSIVTLNCTDLVPGEIFSRYLIRGSGVYMGFPWSLKLLPVADVSKYYYGERVNEPIPVGSFIEGVITNAHVANTFYSSLSKEMRGECWVEFPDVEGYSSIRTILEDTDLAVESYIGNWVKKEDDNFDYAVLGLYIRRDFIIEPLKTRLLIEYEICDNVEVGDKVYVFGYPAAAFNTTEITPVLGVTNIIVSDGIISGKSGNNFFTTAKIDAGNSGGIAVRKKAGAICLVGLPTWVAEGEYENLGVIQPMSNILGDIK